MGAIDAFQIDRNCDYFDSSCIRVGVGYVYSSKNPNAFVMVMVQDWSVRICPVKGVSPELLVPPSSS